MRLGLVDRMGDQKREKRVFPHEPVKMPIPGFPVRARAKCYP